MVLTLIVLWSLCAVYFIRLLTKKNMKTAAIVTAVLYCYVLVWTFATFVIDVADLGLSDYNTREALLHGSNIYHSFVELTNAMSVMSLPMLEAIVVVALVIFISALAVLLHGLIDFSGELLRYIRDSHFRFVKNIIRKLEFNTDILPVRSALRMYCRANC